MELTAYMNRLPVLDKGWEWLAGAGPGDPGLISLLTLRGLQQADVIVYDALVSQEILDMAHEAAVLEYAGKRGGRPSAKQSDISERLVELARAGKKVLRLKGGDPLVFGRGGGKRPAISSRMAFRFASFPVLPPALGGWLMLGFRLPTAIPIQR